MSVFTSDVHIGDIEVARSMYGDKVRIGSNDGTIYVLKDELQPLIEALLYVQEKL